MRCRLGDLAFFVGINLSKCPKPWVNIGKVVTCIRYMPAYNFRFVTGETQLIKHVWMIDPPLEAWDGSQCIFVPDESLRPIRDPGDDARDEMLRPLPRDEHEPTF